MIFTCLSLWRPFGFTNAPKWLIVEAELIKSCMASFIKITVRYVLIKLYTEQLYVLFVCTKLSLSLTAIKWKSFTFEFQIDHRTTLNVVDVRSSKFSQLIHSVFICPAVNAALNIVRLYGHVSPSSVHCTVKCFY